MADLRNRGVRDILIACCDGLAGSGDAIHAAFGRTVAQRCVVHLIRNALRPVARREVSYNPILTRVISPSAGVARTPLDMSERW